MLDATGESVGPAAIVRVDVEHRGPTETYLVDSEGFALSSMRHFYVHAGGLLAKLRDLRALDSPTEGSLVERVSRHARTVATEASMEAAIGFIDCDGETGLVRLTKVAPGDLPGESK